MKLKKRLFCSAAIFYAGYRVSAIDDEDGTAGAAKAGGSVPEAAAQLSEEVIDNYRKAFISPTHLEQTNKQETSLDKRNPHTHSHTHTYTHAGLGLGLGLRVVVLAGILTSGLNAARRTDSRNIRNTRNIRRRYIDVVLVRRIPSKKEKEKKKRKRIAIASKSSYNL